MEDLDTLAGSVAYRHVLAEGVSPAEAQSRLYLVTAAVDRLDMLRDLEAEDLRLSGFVSYTGRSSLEIAVRLESISRRKNLSSSPETVLVGRFTMACRDVQTRKARPIPQLEVSTPEEKTLHEMGREQKERKAQIVDSSLDKKAPNQMESERLHKLFTSAAYSETLCQVHNGC